MMKAVYEHFSSHKFDEPLPKQGKGKVKAMGMPAKRYFRIIEDIASLENLIKRGNEAIRKHC